MNGVPFKIEGDKEKAFVAAYSRLKVLLVSLRLLK